MKSHFRFEFAFPYAYEVKILAAAPLPHPLELLYHYPLELEERDRNGTYVRVVPQRGIAWKGFFALGFDSGQVVNCVSSCPDPTQLCVVAGGYAYVVNVGAPWQWLEIQQRPVTALRSVVEEGLLLFAGFTSITALGSAGVAWTTERLSWEGLRIVEISGGELHGFGWDLASDREVEFTVDLKTGKHRGGAGPGQPG